MEEILINVFGSVGIVSSVMVVIGRNAVQSVLYLVIVFVNMAGMLIVLGVEFMGIILLVVYVGAVAVLFLFVVMMLVPREEYKTVEESSESGMKKVGVGIIIVLGVLVVLLWGEGLIRGEGRMMKEIKVEDWRGVVEGIGNVEVIGQALYTVYGVNLLVAGMVLLVAMIGAIMLVK